MQILRNARVLAESARLVPGHGARRWHASCFPPGSTTGGAPLDPLLGALADNGMANFAAQVSPEDSEAIRHYIIRRANETKAEMEAAAAGGE